MSCVHLKTDRNTPEETMRLLSLHPDRLRHATFLDAEAKQFVRDRKFAIEICLTSNLLCVHPPLPHPTRLSLFLLPQSHPLTLTSYHRCKTVPNLEDHHMRYHYALNHPIAICVSLTLFVSVSLLSLFTSL